MPGDLNLESVLDRVKRVAEAFSEEPVKIEVRKAPARSLGKSYISLSQIGVKPGDPIVVVVFRDSMLVSKIQLNSSEGPNEGDKR
jgi:hypothetical protein